MPSGAAPNPTLPDRTRPGHTGPYPALSVYLKPGGSALAGDTAKLLRRRLKAGHDEAAKPGPIVADPDRAAGLLQNRLHDVWL